jgi:hypothetical protein
MTSRDRRIRAGSAAQKWSGRDAAWQAAPVGQANRWPHPDTLGPGASEEPAQQILDRFGACGNRGVHRAVLAA